MPHGQNNAKAAPVKKEAIPGMKQPGPAPLNKSNEDSAPSCVPYAAIDED